MPPEFAPMQDAEREAVVEILREGRTAAQAIEIATNAHEWGDDLIARVRPSSVVCREGCSWCCYQYVSVTPPEALTLAAWLTERCTPEEREAWIVQIRERAVQAQSKSVGRYRLAKIPCAFLQDGRCTVYDQRPLLCRGYFSDNVTKCETAYKTPLKFGAGVDVPLIPYGMAQLILGGLEEGLTQAGVQSASYELHQAVLTALTTPNAAERWAQGEHIFT